MMTAPPAPLISVVIATFNRASFLGETIDSVLAQSLKDFELIVIDDGSTDHTRQILGAYRDDVRVYHQENHGASAARNFGVRQARGEWIAFQDSDDVCARNHLESLYASAQGNPAAAMVFANGAYLRGNEHHRASIIPAGKSRRLAAAGVTWVDLFDKSIFRLQASLIRKDAYLSLGGLDESFRICHDLDLCFKLFGHYPIIYLDEIVFFYRKHGGNITRDQELRLTENIRVIEKMLAAFPEAEKLLGKKRVLRRLAYRYYRLAKVRWRERNRQEGDHALRQAIALQPFFVKYRFYLWRSWLSNRYMRLKFKFV